MLPKTSTFKSLSYCKTPLNIPRFGRRYFSYSWHVGTSVRVAQSTFAFDCWFQSLIFSLIRVWMRLFLLPSPQIKCNCRAGKALEHTEVHLWNLIIKSPRWQFVSWFCNRSKKLCSDHKPSFYHKMKYHVVFAYLDANKTKQNKTFVHSGQDLKLLQEQFQKPKQFQFMSASQKSPAISTANAFIRLFVENSLALSYTRHTVASNAPVIYFSPRL